MQRPPSDFEIQNVPLFCIRTINEALLWLREFRTLEEAREAIHHWITVEDNERDVHSVLGGGDNSPLEFEAVLSVQEAAQAAA